MNKIFKIFLLLLIFVVISGCTLKPKKNQLPLSLNGKIPVNNIASSTEKIDAKTSGTKKIIMGDWKTYVDKKNGFEIKYPALLNKTGNSGNRIFFYNDNYTFHIEVINKKLDKNTVEGIYGKITSKDLEEITINSIISYRFKEGDAGCGGYDYRIPLKNNNTLRLFFVTCDGAKFVDEDQIISTLKFL